ncbi:MAG: universal stress protein [Thermocrispum sp.]
MQWRPRAKSDDPPKLRTPGPIVVGTAGGAESLDAVDWAAAEAATTHRSLRIVHAFLNSMSTGLAGGYAIGDVDVAVREAGNSILERAVQRARTVAADLEITTHLVAGGASPAMLDKARDAQLLVVGSRGRSGMRRLLLGSVSTRVAGHSRRPTVVVHSLQNNPRGPSKARVVVGIDAARSSPLAIDFALRAAAQRGISLTVVSTSISSGREPRVPTPILKQLIVNRTGPLRDVAVDFKIVDEVPERALVAESAGAALVVIGTRSRKGLLCDSVSHTILQHALCPVAVIPSRQ